MSGKIKDNLITKFVFRMPTRQEYRKYTFKKEDGVLKSLEYLVHTTIIDPCLTDYLVLEQEKVTLTEEIGQRLVDMLTCTTNHQAGDTFIVDITQPIVPFNPKQELVSLNPEAENMYQAIESIVLRILSEKGLI